MNNEKKEPSCYSAEASSFVTVKPYTEEALSGTQVTLMRECYGNCALMLSSRVLELIVKS